MQNWMIIARPKTLKSLGDTHLHSGSNWTWMTYSKSNKRPIGHFVQHTSLPWFVFWQTMNKKLKLEEKDKETTKA